MAADAAIARRRGARPVSGPPSRPPGRRGRAVAAATVVVAVLALAACSGDDGFDRDAAVADLQARAGGTLGEDQARCYVDRVLDEIGPGPLAPDAEPSDAQLRRLTAIRVDCIGVADLGRRTGPSGSAPERVPPQPGPQTFGDDPELDALWSACEAGDGPACDELFEAAPLGTEYEAFGATCGGRGAEASCAAAYPALPRTTPSSASSTTATTAAPTPPP